MTIFITGATGFVGRNFLEWVLRNQPDADITCLVRNPHKAQAQWPQTPKQIRWLAGDLLEPETYQAAIREAEVVFHIAALVSLKNGPAFYRMNTDATRCLLQALSSSRPLRRLVCISSISAVDRPPGQPAESPLTEASVPHPNTDYGKSKLMAEQAVTASGLPYAILRPAYIYGPYPRPGSSMDRLILDMQRGARYLQFPYPGCASGIYTDDLSEMMWLSAGHPQAGNQTFFVANPQPVRVAEAFSELAHVLRMPYRPRALSEDDMARYQHFVYRAQPENLLARILFEDYFSCSSEKWTRLTGHRSRYGYGEGLAETVAWYRRNGALSHAGYTS